LILFALLTFVFFAIAAVVIDVGLANLTQAQMQSATDSAALEGCRWRNFDEQLGDSNTEKRRKAGAIVRLAFDDDLHPTQSGYRPDSYEFTQETGTATLDMDDADAAQISAGPGLQVSGGSGAWAANSVVGEQPLSELARIDDPQLQLNRNNVPTGDMVTGSFHPYRSHNESGEYVRDDFTPAPTSTAQVANALSFLVRMRRAGDSNAVDVQNNVSSSLPTLPVVFGLGSTILQDPTNDWDPRRDGITVRATSIASARPAMRVGRPPCGDSGVLLFDHEPDVGGSPYREHISGLVPFYIDSAAWVSHFRGPAWQASSSTTAGRVRVMTDGRIVLDDDPTFTVGHFLFTEASAPLDPCESEPGWPDTVGRSVQPVSASPVRHFRYTTRKPAYIAIVEPIADTATGISVLRVVGYGFAHLWPVGYDPTSGVPPATDFPGTGVFVISAGESITHGVNCWIAQDNASAVLKSAANESFGVSLNAQTLRDVLRASNRLAYGEEVPDQDFSIHDYTLIQRGTVLAPALTR
jgi:hypothetical protein